MFFYNLLNGLEGIGILLIFVGFIGGKIFGWGGWHYDDNSIWKESGCFTEILIIGVVILGICLYVSN